MSRRPARPLVSVMVPVIAVLALVGGLLVASTGAPTSAATRPGTTAPAHRAGPAATAGAAGVGRLRGRVVSGAAPVRGATVHVQGRAHRGSVHRVRVTGPAGRFHLRLRAGRYHLTVSARGLVTARFDVRVRRHHRTRRLVHLPPPPTILPPVRPVTLAGRVVDGSGHGWPLYARVRVDGPGLHRSLWTDPVTGRWALRVPGGTSYRLTTVVAYDGYQTPVTLVAVGGASVQRDLRVPVDPVQCWDAPGYESLQGPGHDGPCRLLTGGLVVGTVSSGLTGAGLANAQVAAGEQTTVTLPRASRPSGIQGAYALFLPGGSHSVTYSRPLYAPSDRTVVVAADRVTSSDVALAAGRLVVSPASLDATARSGASPVTGTVTITNDGTATTRVTVDESRAGLGGVSTPPASPTWQDLPDLPVAVAGNATAVLDGVLYSVGGSTISGGVAQPTSAVYAYAGVGWTRVADLGRPLTELNAAAVDGRLVVNGGVDVDGNGYHGTEIYDPATDTWAYGQAVAQEKDSSGAAVLGDRLYVVAGCGETGCESAPDPGVESYDVPDDAVTELAPYPGGQEQPLCGGIDGRIYCTGGSASDGNGGAASPTDASYAYDPSADRWSVISSPPVTLAGAAVAVAAGRLVLNGGTQDGVTSDRTWSYDPGSDNWTELPTSGRPTVAGGGACGFYRVGGLDAAGSRVTSVQRLTGYDVCGDAGVDVDWLSLDQRSVTLTPGSSTTVTVALDPATLTPGSYAAALRVEDDSPGDLAPLPITFTVTSACLAARPTAAGGSGRDVVPAC